MFSDSRLRIFAKVVELGSFTQAAKHLGISQPAVSQSIAEIEKEVKDSVLIRKKEDNSLHLTPKGEVLYKYAVKILHLYQRLNNELLPSHGYEAEHLRICALPLVAKHILPDFLKEFSLSYPQINIMLSSEDSDVIIKKVLDNDADLGIVESYNTADIFSNLIVSPFLKISLSKDSSSFKQFSMIYKGDSTKQEIIKTLTLAIETYA